MPTTCSHVLRYSNNSDLYTAWIKKSKNVFPGKSSSSFNLLSFYHWKKRHFSGYSSVPIHETTSVTTRVLVRFNMATAKWWGIFSKLWPSTASNRSPHLKQDWKLLDQYACLVGLGPFLAPFMDVRDTTQLSSRLYSPFWGSPSLQ